MAEPKVCVALANGDIRVALPDGPISATQASFLVTEICKAAVQAHEMSGKSSPDRLETEVHVPYIHPTVMALSGGLEPGFVLLKLQFGAAEIGIPISISVCKELGQALIAASADTSKPH